VAARRWALHHAPDGADPLVDEPLAADLSAYRRGGLWAIVNLHDVASKEVDLPAPAIFDTHDPSVSAVQPRTGRIQLEPRQALLLAQQ